jgi:regulator of protease activity HflC (stomatin/prohibitin superfamily)
VLEAEGNAAAILARATASASAIDRLSIAIGKTSGKDAVALQIAEKYVEAFGKIAKESTTVLLPANASDPSAMVASAMSIFSNIQKKNAKQAVKDAEESAKEGVVEEYTLDSFDDMSNPDRKF